jgi:alpha-beta hydrolase superfamily lysophospholipase
MLRALRAVCLLLAGAILGVVALWLLAGSRGAQPEAWHRLVPRAELTARDPAATSTFSEYLALESRLFDETAAELARRVSRFPAYSRFDPSSPTSPGRFDRDWNRTYELEPAGRVAGEALLLHGLSDSPYSLRAVGRLLADRGFHVVGLRIPGHGTVPGALAAATRADWRAAVRIAVAATGGAARAHGAPFVVVGYSNGAALALDYTLDALDAPTLPVPDRLIFLSPALAVTPSARFARWPARLSRLPRLPRLAWTSIEPEFDPFKFNSFPVLAGAEIHELTEEIDARLQRLDASPETHVLPPILAIQSVVDATVPPVASLTRLFSHVRENGAASELVLFDANRAAGVRGLLSPSVDALLSLAREQTRFPFALTLVTNAGTGSPVVERLRRAPNELDVLRTPLSLAWPPGIYSLSHVAIPFPSDDPAYGLSESPVGPPFPFGALDLKGERGALVIPDRLLTRLRCNPFFDVVAEEIAEFLGLDTTAIEDRTQDL